MDIIVKTVLDFIQKNKGTENAVLAGGSVRDSILNLEPRDYDIFIPASPSRKQDHELLHSLRKEFGVEKIEDKGKDYGPETSTIKQVGNFTFEGKEFDLVFKYFTNDEEFGNKVIKEFDYGINMAYYNGLYIEESKEFQTDRDNWWLTLINLRSLDELPKAMSRYDYINTKIGRQWRFRSTCLTLNTPKKEEDKKFVKKKVIDIFDEFVGGQRLDPLPIMDEPAIPARQNRLVGVPWNQAGNIVIRNNEGNN